MFRHHRRPELTRTPLGIILIAATAMMCGCQSSTTYNKRGVQQFQQGDYQSALDTFQNALAKNPNDADANYNLAATLHDWGRRGRDTNLLDQSESLYHRCLDLNGNHVECYRALAVLLVDTDRRDSAFTLLERWAQRSPSMAAPLVELARLNEEFGKDDSARQLLAQALDTDSSSSRAWAALGRLRENEGRYAQALTDYQHAYNLNRSNPGIPQQIASLQQRLARAPQSGTVGRLAQLGSPTSSTTGLSSGVAGSSTASGQRVTRSSSNWIAR